MNLPLTLTFFYLLFCSYTDIKRKYIYYESTIILTIVIILFQFINITILNHNLIQYILSFIPGIIMILLSFITRENIGYGDSILLAICALCVGIWNGLFIIMCSFIYSAIFSLFLLLKGRKKTDTIPFVPFIFISLITYFFAF